MTTMAVHGYGIHPDSTKRMTTMAEHGRGIHPDSTNTTAQAAPTQ